MPFSEPLVRFSRPDAPPTAAGAGLKGPCAEGGTDRQDGVDWGGNL